MTLHATLCTLSRLRRLRNTSLEVDLSRRLEILEDACVKIKTSGHDDKFVREAVSKGINNFNEKVRRSMLPETDRGYLPLNQGGHWKRNEKRTATLKQEEKQEERLPVGWKSGNNISHIFPKHQKRNPL